MGKKERSGGWRVRESLWDRKWRGIGAHRSRHGCEGVLLPWPSVLRPPETARTESKTASLVANTVVSSSSLLCSPFSLSVSYEKIAIICECWSQRKRKNSRGKRKRLERLGGVWFVILNYHFQFLNNISCIFTHFFTSIFTNIFKQQFSIFKHMYQTDPKGLNLDRKSVV